MRSMITPALGAAAAIALLTAAAPVQDPGLRASPRNQDQSLTAGAAAAVEASTYAIDSGHSCALFRVVHLGAGPFWGRFNTVSGEFKYAEGSAASLSFNVEIDVTSIDSGMDGLDEHLKTPDFFDMEKYGMMTFVSKSAKKSEDGVYMVTGDLTILAVTKEVTARIEHVGTADKGRGMRCGFEATFAVKRSDFGLMYLVDEGALGDETKIIVALEGMTQAAGGERGAGGGRGAGGFMTRLDTDGDGKISREEAPDRLADRFDDIDADGDGFLTEEEMRSAFGRGGRGGGGGG